MSVLVEALSLIIPRKVLDGSYPGGADAFMLEMFDPDVHARLVCADDRLVSVSFSSAAEAEMVGAELRARGIVAIEDDRYQELAFVDQARGPTLPCDWLEWQVHPDGFTYCWVSGTDPEPIHGPQNWTPPRPRAVAQSDVRDEPGRCMKLAAEDGMETWIDFETGAIMDVLPSRAVPDESRATATETSEGGEARHGMAKEAFDESSGAELGALLTEVREFLDAEEYRYTRIEGPRLWMSMYGRRGAYTFFYAADDSIDYVGIVGGFGSYVPADRRLAVAELLSRINVRLRVGNFQLDFDDGDVRYRIGYDVEDGTFSRAMANNLLGCALSTMDMYHEALMRVAFGGVDPEAALAEVEE